jgi:hypothetical protein
MARVSPLLPSLGAGELSPWLEGRADFDQYAKGLRVCENFIPLIQGAATKRPGTYFVNPVKNSAVNTIIVPFVFSDAQAYILEFGSGYIRFYTNRGQVLSGGVAYEVVTPYAVADLAGLRFAQSADVFYIAHANYPPKKLSRFAPTNWTLTDFVARGGPFLEQNTTATAMQSSATVGGVVGLTTTAAVFTAAMVGGLVRIEQTASPNVRPWEAGTDYAALSICRYNGNYYSTVGGGLSGGDPPVHTEGAELDGAGTTAITWEYLHSGFGVARIKTFVSSTSVTADVLSYIPDGAVSTNTTKWSIGAWSGYGGYPGSVTFYGDRLYWAGSSLRPQTVWGSVVSDYENYKAGVTDDSALTITLNSSDVNSIRWMIGDEKGLLIGSLSGEWVLRPSSQNEALTPFNAQALRTTDYGSNLVRPTRVGKAVLFVQRAARKLREFAYLLDVDGFRAPDMTVRADHISKSGFSDLTFQSQPHSIVWAPRVDGQLCGFTYDREQEATAWHRHILGGTSAVVKSVAAIPAPDGAFDDLWMIVQRFVNGVSVQHIEYLTRYFDQETEQEDQFFVDCGRTYSGAPATIISGLSHLEGQTVAILADGAIHPRRVVTGGQITLDHAASVVHVGLPFRARLQTERTSAGAGDGTAQGKPKRIAEIIMRLYRSMHMRYGTTFDNMDERELRNSDDPMGSPPSLFSGDYRALSPSGWETDGCICIESDEPTALNVLSLTPIMEVTSPR